MRLSRLILARDDRATPRWKPVSRLLRWDRSSSVSDILRSRRLKRDPDDPDILGQAPPAGGPGTGGPPAPPPGGNPQESIPKQFGGVHAPQRGYEPGNCPDGYRWDKGTRRCVPTRSARSLSELVKQLKPPVVDEVGPRRVQPPGSTGNEPLPAVPLPDELEDEVDPEPQEEPESDEPDWTEQYNSPNDYKRDKGRCPPGCICNDRGHCVKERRMMQKRRERDNTRKTFTQRQHDKLRQRSKRRREQLEDRMRGKPREDRDE